MIHSRSLANERRAPVCVESCNWDNQFLITSRDLRRGVYVYVLQRSPQSIKACRALSREFAVVKLLLNNDAQHRVQQG
jgi:hypothetical protein